MKKILIILITIIITIGSLIFNLPTNNFNNVITNKNEANNINNYYKTTNKPIFYGAISFSLTKDSLFSPLDTRYRIFAKDFEDGDLTPKIKIISNNVNTSLEGEYEIVYQVTDSHNNTSSLTVPVTVNTSSTNKVVRRIYNTPSVWNMDLVGIQRANYGDRQILGFFIQSNEKIKVRSLTGDLNLTVSNFNNDSHTETTTVIPKNGDWIDVTNNYSFVPLITSPVNSKAEEDLVKDITIEIEYDNTVKELNYYHYLDNQSDFYDKWNNDVDSYSVVESETLTILVPYHDRNKLINYYKNGFTSLDNFLNYYQKVIEQYDRFLGLSFNPDDVIDQNVRTKYMVKANINGAGAAYYGTNHVGIHSSSVAPFFEMNWGGLHEIGHGYQGSLGRNGMALGEVSNNILGHYVQQNKELNIHNVNWMGSFSGTENTYNDLRLNNQGMNDIDLRGNLYVLVNLLNSFDSPEEAYATINKYYRRSLFEGKTITNQDAYSLALAEKYNVNILPYFEAWKIKVSDDVNLALTNTTYPTLNILGDIIKDNNKDIIKNDYELKGNYSLVTNNQLSKYNINSSLEINIDIDNLDNIVGKYLYIKENNNIVKKVKIESNKIKIDNIPVGTYYLQLPSPLGIYEYSNQYISINNLANVLNVSYKPLVTDHKTLMTLKVLGIYGTSGLEASISKDNLSLNIKYGGANLGNQNSPWNTEDYKDTVYSSFSVYDDKNNLVYSSKTTGNKYYNDGNVDTIIPININYKIELYHYNPTKFVKVFDTNSNQVINDYNTTTTTTTYTIAKDGLLMNNMSEDQIEEIAYQQLLKNLSKKIEDYQNEVSEEILSNRNLDTARKNDILIAIDSLREEDKTPYISLYNKIVTGGKPQVIAINNSNIFPYGSNVDLISLIKAIDNEDGNMVLNKQNTFINTNLSSYQAGNYIVKYSVIDSDKNITDFELNVIIDEDKTTPLPPVVIVPPKPEEKPIIKPPVVEKPSDNNNNNNSGENNTNNNNKEENNNTNEDNKPNDKDEDNSSTNKPNSDKDNNSSNQENIDNQIKNNNNNNIIVVITVILGLVILLVVVFRNLKNKI